RQAHATGARRDGPDAGSAGPDDRNQPGGARGRVHPHRAGGGLPAHRSGTAHAVRLIPRPRRRSEMARVFVYDQREFPDPDPKLPVDEVRKQLAEFFPELANAEAREERRGEDTVVTFTKRIGTKGLARPTWPRDVVAVLRRVPPRRLRILELAEELVG